MYDLHTHSLASDGILRPEALVSSAKSAGVSCLALTDHDTVAGLVEAAEAARVHGIRLIAGTELSCQWHKRAIHVVGLNIDPEHAELVRFLAAQQQVRQTRAVEIDQRLQKLGIDGALEGAKAIADGAVLGRPHFAQHLVDVGRVPTVAAAFKRYLGTGKPADVTPAWPTLEKAATVIKAAGGVAVLAHPLKYKLTRTKLNTLLADFRHAGGQAVEVISGKQDPTQTRDMTKLANQHDLVSSIGSDFHRPGQPWHALGVAGDIPSAAKPVWDLFAANA